MGQREVGGWGLVDEGNVSGGAVNGSGIDESVWSVEKNGVICPPPRRSGSGVGKSGGVCPLHRIDVGRNDLVGPLRQIESDVGDVSSHCFSASLPPVHHPYISSGDSYLSHGPTPGPNHEKTHPSTVSPSQPLQLPQPSASVPTSRPPLFPLELHWPLAL